jgi:hypothetical protein
LASLPTSSTLSFHFASQRPPIPAKAPEWLDLDQELEESIVNAALCPLANQSSGSLRIIYEAYIYATALLPLPPSLNSKTGLAPVVLIRLLMEKMLAWIQTRGLTGIAGSFILLHCVVCC